jgi:hypothetical protein
LCSAAHDRHAVLGACDSLPNPCGFALHRHDRLRRHPEVIRFAGMFDPALSPTLTPTDPEGVSIRRTRSSVSR